ncbi:MAG: DUF3325 family protein [Pseudomonadaceae bacterium]
MAELWPALLAFLLAYLAFARLALTQPAHRQAVAPDALPPRYARLLGATLSGSGLVLLLGTEGGGFGALLWLLLLSAAAFCVAQTLSWKPHWLRWLVRTRAEHADANELR